MFIWDGKQFKEVPTATGNKLVAEGKAIDMSKHDGSHVESLERMFDRPFYKNKMMTTKAEEPKEQAPAKKPTRRAKPAAKKA